MQAYLTCVNRYEFDIHGQLLKGKWQHYLLRCCSLILAVGAIVLILVGVKISHPALSLFPQIRLPHSHIVEKFR